MYWLQPLISLVCTRCPDAMPRQIVTLQPPVPEVYVYEAPKRKLVDVEAPPPPPKEENKADDGKERKRAEELKHLYEITTVTSDIK